ncbi:nucleoside 2-deoxyribosyltransferase [Furfurilactobacillus siliginis]|uniref:Nucleoside 2-deoxyribosyltransferase n=1 Tax=Furfurilactobacillus siliginis TaxID=348151 RepID=A0A0R2L1R6_9LACO|nr:nucleoside 2-deoxyribosyltransferase [Furfurilactobacillus siliginis]KRN95392.1 nucleoside 2-deoxyribosyltransferase [Furfurilactobacillus siliginis]GEK28172.1 nucleoside deoxyribosyltransferase [Furfurilactobacillus siliginis]
MKSIYLASPFFDEDQLDRVKRVEKALADNKTVGNVFSPRTSQFPELTFGSPEWQTTAYEHDLAELTAADVIVAVADFTEDSVDSGTAFEIGYAAALKKPIVLLHEKDSLVNLMLAKGAVTFTTKAEEIADFDFNELPALPYPGEVQ